MNIDFISREALKIKLDAELMDNSNYLNIHEQIKDIIDNAPEVEPEKVLIANVNFDEDKLREIVLTEVIDKIISGELMLKDERPQGKWIKTNELIGENFHNVFVCNQCGARAIDKLKFCPECGADMKGGAK